MLVKLPSGVTAENWPSLSGTYHSFALASNGTIYAWGNNANGEAGNGTETSTATPVVVSMPAGVTATSIAAGANSGMAIGSDGNLYAWGYNGLGELGNGTTTTSDTPVQVGLSPVAKPPTAVASGSSADHAFAIAPPTPAPTTTTLSTSPSTVAYGQTVTITAQVSRSDGGGTIDFLNNGHIGVWSSRDHPGIGFVSSPMLDLRAGGHVSAHGDIQRRHALCHEHVDDLESDREPGTAGHYRFFACNDLRRFGAVGHCVLRRVRQRGQRVLAHNVAHVHHHRHLLEPGGLVLVVVFGGGRPELLLHLPGRHCGRGQGATRGHGILAIGDLWELAAGHHGVVLWVRQRGQRVLTHNVAHVHHHGHLLEPGGLVLVVVFGGGRCQLPDQLRRRDRVGRSGAPRDHRIIDVGDLRELTAGHHAVVLGLRQRGQRVLAHVRADLYHDRHGDQRGWRVPELVFRGGRSELLHHLPERHQHDHTSPVDDHGILGDVGVRQRSARSHPDRPGLQNGETTSVLGAGLTCSTTASASVAVGTYPTTCSGASDSNYAITYVAGSIAVTPAPLTITATSGTMTYGGAVPVISPIVSGLQNGENVSVLGVGLTCTTSATPTIGVGTYPSTCSGASDANYTLTYVGGTVIINAAPLSITASSNTMIYGGVVPRCTRSCRGFRTARRNRYSAWDCSV